MENNTKKRRKNSTLPFANNLKKLMKEKGLSQRQLAQQAEIKLSTLNDWIGGSSPADLLAVASVARILGVDFQVLLLGSRPESSVEEKSIHDLFEVDDSAEFSGLFLVEAKRLKRRQR